MNLDKYARNNCLFYKEIGDNRKVCAHSLIFFGITFLCIYLFILYFLFLLEAFNSQAKSVFYK